MSDRFIKYIPSQKVSWLRENHPNAFLLLSLIAERARRIPGNDGLEMGECHIGDYEKAGIYSRKAYRIALDLLIRIKAIEKIETCRSRKSKNLQVGATERATERATEKTTNRATIIMSKRATVGTKVKLLDTEFWDINIENKGHRNDDQKGDQNNHSKGHQKGHRKGHEQECYKKNEKKEQQPQTPSSKEGAVVVFSCLQVLDLDEKYKIELSSRYQESIVIDAVAAITQPGFKPQGSLLQAIRSACKNGWKPKKSSAETIEKNRNAAILLAKKRKNYHVCVDYLEIYHGLSDGGMSIADYIEYDMPHELFMAKIEQKATL